MYPFLFSFKKIKKESDFFRKVLYLYDKRGLTVRYCKESRLLVYPFLFSFKKIKKVIFSIKKRIGKKPVR